MKVDAFRELLASLCSRPKLRLEEGTIFVPETPIDLGQAIWPWEGGWEEVTSEVLGPFLETEEEIDALDSSDPVEFLEKSAGASAQVLLGFSWESVPMLSSSLSLSTLSLGGSKGYCYLTPDDPGLPWQVFAAVEPFDKPALYGALVGDLLQDNGESYGVGLFGGLPESTANCAPTLLWHGAVKEAFFRWMDWAEREGYARWLDLWREIREGETLGQRRGRAKRKLEKTAIGKLLTESEEGEDAELSKAQKQAILDAYFENTYTP